MPIHVVLIDYENTQPSDLHLLTAQGCIVRVFFGKNQKSVPIEMSTALQPLGTSVEYVRGEHAGRNAIDFLLTFHFGQLAAVHRDARFWIVSKDRDFDSLIKHLQDVQISCNRVVSIADILGSQQADSDSDSRIAKIVCHLFKMNAAKPRRSKTLRSTIRNVFTGIDEPAIDALVQALRERKVLTEAEGKISYPNLAQAVGRMDAHDARE